MSNKRIIKKKIKKLQNENRRLREILLTIQLFI
ncbi:hypothetical protein SAMN04488528_1001134 [Clostridium frigidicarnis]|uniref:Uncharacterized protein n=1 Tax=Clostridium frigidicarnis TaxID=84698 RepID=A0A1I0V3H4_9CLOT|nr:hypothetical protein SAMN04488528_1001134 [Clostridium frigidicarnis]